MKVHTATLAGGTTNADRVFVTDNAVIVLDGASAHEAVDVDPATYAQLLGQTVAEQLDRDPGAALPRVVDIGISRAAMRLRLTPGSSTAPSSTVSILRVHQNAADLYVLGDSPIIYGTAGTAQRLVDDRLDAVATPERRYYVSQLRTGHGYGDHHRDALAALQREQRRQRNTPAGYWIAEADHTAAHHAHTLNLDPTSIAWAVLATDGAADLVDHTGRSWPEISQHGPDQLSALLTDLHRWETATDPNGRTLPRAKQHDDKTIAAVPNIF